MNNVSIQCNESLKSMNVVLTFNPPSRQLHAHNSGRWRGKSNAVKSRRNAARDVATIAIIENGLRDSIPWATCEIQFRFFVPDNIRRDVCNLIQQEKPTIDGIVDSGLITGDHWQVAKIRQPIVAIDADNPRTEIEIFGENGPIVKKSKIKVKP